MRLDELLKGLPLAVVGGDPHVEIAEVRDDSRQVRPGDLFVAVRGQTVDGHQFVASAAERGASAVIVEEEAAASLSASSFAGTRVRVRSTQAALAVIAANRFGNPADGLTLVGVTGTNGKTTTTFLAEALLAAAGGVPGVIGTVAYRAGARSWPAPFTTPTPLELHRVLAEMRRLGCTQVAMECSSHALELGRLDGLGFQVVAFTNLTQDHLDFHRTMEAYRDAKTRLVAELLMPGGVAVINIDGDYGRDMVGRVRGRVLTVSARATGADVRAAQARYSVDGIEAEVDTPRGRLELRSPLIGAFNLENLLVAVGIGLALGLEPPAIARALGSVAGVPGRLERVVNHRGVSVFVDYAHTPDALERVMAALRPLAAGRLIVVFGCGGDRDRGKRPRMGQAVARAADLAIVTSDNPRTEDPTSIVRMVLDGVLKEPSPLIDASELAAARRGHLALVDRRQAIGAALAGARPGDVVLIAGKGHEDYQVVGKTRHHFDDREEARAALEKLAKREPSAQS